MSMLKRATAVISAIALCSVLSINAFAEDATWSESHTLNIYTISISMSASKTCELEAHAHGDVEVKSTKATYTLDQDDYSEETTSASASITAGTGCEFTFGYVVGKIAGGLVVSESL